MKELILLSFLFSAIYVSSLAIPGLEQITLKGSTDGLRKQIDSIIERNTSYQQRIAIVGSGITGAATAYALHEGFRVGAAPHRQPIITVFERNFTIGGRFRQAFAYNDPRYPVDTCAATFSTSDTCIVQSANSVGLSTDLLDVRKPAAGVGFWNGEKFVGFVEEDGFREPELWSEFRKLKWYQRYGESPWNSSTRVRLVRQDFDLLLSASIPQEDVSRLPGQRNLSKAIEDVILEDFVQSFLCSDEHFCNEDRRREKRFVEEVASAAQRDRFFGNFLELNVLEFVLGFEEQDNVIRGGNLRLIDRLLTLSNADVRLNLEVKNIGALPGQPVKVSSGGVGNGPQFEEEFDIVVIANSLELANITFDPALPDLAGSKQLYRDSFVTHFTTESQLNSSYFNRDGTMPQDVLTSQSIDAVLFGDEEPPFFSLTLLRRVKPPTSPGQTENLYKLVSQDKIPDAEIERFLTVSEDDDKPVITWIDRQPLPRSVPVVQLREADSITCVDVLQQIEIVPGIFYAGGGEQVIGHAEFGCRMGVNAANLILDGALD